MKKIILYILVFFLTYSFTYSNYGDVTMTSLGNPETNCSVSVNSRYYLGTRTYLLDLLGHSGTSNTNDWFIGFSSTNVGVYNPNNNIRINGGFQFTSRILPSDESSVVAMFNLAGTDIIGHPVSRNDLAAQVVYNVSIAPKISGTRSGTLGYSTYYSNSWVNSSKTINNYNVDTSSIYTERECFNIYVSWCGDGVLDSSNGESCDPNDLSRTGWGTGGCNNSCQPVNTTTPSCTSLTASPITGVNSLTSTMTCTGNNASTYTINCGNGQTINASTGTCTYNTVGTYTPTCFVNGTITSSACQQTVSVTTTSSSSSSTSSSGGSTQYQCRDISMSGNQITCTGNHLVQTFRLNCDGTYLFAPAISGAGNTTNATFTCNDNRASCSVYNQVVTESSFYTWNTNPACNLTPSSSSSSGGSTSSSGGSSSSSSGGGFSPDYCGDGIVQRPNDNLQLEECDFGTGTWPAWCNRTTCKIDGISTIPNDGEIIFGPRDNLIIGNNMNPYSAYSLDRPSILNNSPYDLYFDSLCVTKKSGTTIDGSTVCESIGRTLFPGVRHTFSTYPNFIGNTSSLIAGTYGDNTLVTTIEHEGTLYTNAYFASELKVRVSKPSIVTTGGGTSFINNTNNISNVSEVSSITGNEDINKNFVGAGVSTGNISSYANDVTDTNSVDKISQEGNNYNNAVNNSNNITLPSIGSTSNIGDFNNYNGINNAYILKNTSFIIGSNIFSGLTGSRTYIIENGDLIINENINYPNNIAFVVKGGNIKIDKNVTSINGTYISIPNGSNGGEIIGINGKTNNVLLIKGSIYGNVEKLVSQRDFVKENSGLLTVGTIVSFGSSVFRDPAPLTSTFINEYMEATKVAK